MEKLTWQKTGDCLVGRYSGEITMEITQDFKREMEKALEKSDAKALVLDLSEVSFMDSSGIGFLVACNTRLQTSGKMLALLRPSPQVRKTLALVQLMEFFKVADTEADLENLVKG